MKINAPSTIALNGFTTVVDYSSHPELGADLSILRLQKGSSFTFSTEDKEYILILFSGSAIVEEGVYSFSLERHDVTKENTVFVRVSKGKEVRVKAKEESEFLVPSAPNALDFPSTIGHAEESVAGLKAHEGRTMRIKRPLYSTPSVPSSVLFVGELITHQGSWACYPPHQHVEPEIYFYRFFPKGGYAFVEDGDKVHRIEENDTVGVTNSDNHSQTTAPAFTGYILWVQRLTGPGIPIKYTLDPRYAHLEDQN